jgi:multiple sugar transport system permease protein
MTNTIRPRMTGRERREAWEALAYLSPWILGFILFTAGPILFSLGLSFFRWDVITPAQFVGTANYQEIARDPLILKSLGNTLYYVALFLPLSNIVALGMAMLLNQKVKGLGIFRTLFYIPTLTQGVATFTLWAAIYEPETGLMNQFLRNFIANPPGWLIDPAWSKPALVVMGLWAVGGTMLIYLAGLQGVPASLYEAADLDGAGPWQTFCNVTVPMLSPTIFFNVIMATIGGFQVFGAAWILTGGGPSNSTLFYVYYLFNRAFVYFNLGYASAMAWLLFGVVLAITLFQLRMAPKWVHYG